MIHLSHTMKPSRRQTVVQRQSLRIINSFMSWPRDRRGRGNSSRCAGVSRGFMMTRCQIWSLSGYHNSRDLGSPGPSCRLHPESRNLQLFSLFQNRWGFAASDERVLKRAVILGCLSFYLICNKRHKGVSMNNSRFQDSARNVLV